MHSMRSEMNNLFPDLKAVIDAWPDIPETVRAGIVAMVTAAKDKDK